MSSADEWLGAYGRDWPAPIQGPLFWACVPLSVLGLTGLLWSLPVPASFQESSEILNWGTLFLMAAIVYYFIVSINLAFGSLPFIMLVIGALNWLDRLQTPLWLISGAVLFLAASAQWLGEHLRGRRVQLIRDLQYLMLGPLWLLAAVYRRLGIPY